MTWQQYQTLPTLTTIGNDFKITKNRTRYDLRNFFTNRIVMSVKLAPNGMQIMRT